jgi:hypothetical protein
LQAFVNLNRPEIAGRIIRLYEGLLMQVQG